MIGPCVFNDILIYSKSWADHLRHVHDVFQLMYQHLMALKMVQVHFWDANNGILGPHHFSEEGGYGSRQGSKCDGLTDTTNPSRRAWVSWTGGVLPLFHF